MTRTTCFKLSPRSALTLLAALILTAGRIGAEELPAGDRFAIAIENGDLDAVRALVRDGASADTPIGYGDHRITPLMKACWDGREEIAVLLLDAGADVNAADENGQTALFNAVSRDRVALAQLLLDRGAKVNLRDSREFTPLVQAVAAGNPAMVEVLAAGSADLAAETHGMTPLMFAASTGNPDMIRLLATLGAEVDQGSKGGDPGTTALFHAVYSGKVEAAQALIDARANVNARSKSGDTPMKVAINGDQAEMISLLARAGAGGAPKDLPAARPSEPVEAESVIVEAPPGQDPQKVDEARRALAANGIDLDRLDSELQEAVDLGDLPLAQQLVDAGANAGAVGEYGESTLLRAAGIGNLAMIELLIRAGADVNRPNEYQVTPLAAAAEREHTEVVSLLLAAGADVNTRNTYGGTALQVAVLRGATDIVKLLIAAGADVARDRKELIEIAKRENHPDIERLLRGAPATPR